MKLLCHYSLFAAVFAFAGLIGCSKSGDAPAPAASYQPTEAEKLWTELVDISRPAPIPEEWRIKEPPPEAVNVYAAQQRERAIKAADIARDIYQKYPTNKLAGAAREKEFEQLQIAVKFGASNLVERMAASDTERLKDPTLSSEERFQLRLRFLQNHAVSQQSNGMRAVMTTLDKGAHEILKDYPRRPELVSLMMVVAENCDSARARTIIEEIVSHPTAPAEVKAAAHSLRQKLELEGQPWKLKFTAKDGREVDSEKLRGKVVLMDFWATWCGPCIRRIPEIKAAYEKFHAQGFEIVGINLDNSAEQLDAFLAKEKLPWPHQFEGKGWDSSSVRAFHVTAIPSMWLIDRKGIIRDVRVTEDLAAGVEKLLAEKP